MRRVIPGMGVSTSLTELIENYCRLARVLPDVIVRFPDSRVVRHESGNLAIVTERNEVAEVVGFINVRTGHVTFIA
jgi:hypothetical protein